MNRNIVFKIEDTFFGIATRNIKRFGKFNGVKPLPDSPEWISGLVKFRDRILPYVRLWNILKLSPPEKEILLIPEVQNSFAIGISDILGIYELEVVEEKGEIIKAPYITGYSEFNENIVIIINPDKILSDEQIEMIKGLNKGGNQ